ncbi:MAG: TolC family protein [Paludibacter sp.]|nr:TolC family protein [Paludibacter sp.]
MRRLKFRTGMVLCLMSILPMAMLKAQDTVSVSLSKAIEIALSESPTIKIANKEIKRVDYSKKERLSGLFPTISGSGTYGRTLAKSKNVITMNGQEITMEFGVDNTFSAGVSASLPIISPTLWATLKLNEYDAELALESARSSKLSLVNQVTKAYYAILLAQDSYDVFNKSYQSSTENAKIISDKYKQGTVSEYEWIRADVQQRNSQTNLVSAKNAVNLSKLQLKLLMGLDMYTEIKVTGKLSDFENDLYGTMLEVDTTKLTSNTDLKQLDIKTKQLKQSLNIQKTAWLPTLGASINYSQNTMGNDEVNLSDYTTYPASTVGLSLQIPIFQGGSKHYKYKQLQMQLSELKDQRENLKKSIDLQAINCMNNMKNAIEKIASNKKALSQAEKAMLISQKRYEVGAGTYLDVTNSELAYVQAGLSYNQSIYDYLSAKSDLEKLFGSEY